MFASAVLSLLMSTPSAQPAAGLAEAATAAKQALRQKHPGEAARIDRGVDQAARYWRAKDGGAASFRAFVEAEFLPQGETYEATFRRLELAFEHIGGYLNSLGRDLRHASDADVGPLLAIDGRLAGWNPAVHVAEDLARNKTTFVILLNFPLTTLEERLREGTRWSPRQWAEVRLGQGLIACASNGPKIQLLARVPADVAAKTAEALARAEDYIAGYNVYMHHLLTPAGERPFPPGLRLISHWNLRDELKARYADKDGLARQRMIQLVMERIVRQEIPAAIINNPLLDWEPRANTVSMSSVRDVDPPKGSPTAPRNDREPDTRYRHWYDVFAAEHLADAYHPEYPTFIDRRFQVDREISESQVRALLESVLTSPLGERVARVVATRLGRTLEIGRAHV